jgi:DNA invertase Pin-like site-specific DNA recombinase
VEREQEHRHSERKRVAVYARVSTTDQSCEAQLRDLHEYVAARGWQATEYLDHGVSGAKDRRPGLDRLLAAVAPLGQAVFTIIAAIAQLERSLIAERVRAGLRRAKADGKRLGRPRVEVDQARLESVLRRGTRSRRQRLPTETGTH